MLLAVVTPGAGDMCPELGSFTVSAGSLHSAPSGPARPVWLCAATSLKTHGKISETQPRKYIAILTRKKFLDPKNKAEKSFSPRVDCVLSGMR